MDNKPTQETKPNKAKKVEEAPKKTSRYFFPEQETTIVASSVEEATEKLNSQKAQ